MVMVVMMFTGRNDDNLGTNDCRSDCLVSSENGCDLRVDSAPWKNAWNDRWMNLSHFLHWLGHLRYCGFCNFLDCRCLDDSFGDNSLCDERFDGYFDGFHWFCCWLDQFVVCCWLNQFVVRCWFDQFVVWCWLDQFVVWCWLDQFVVWCWL